ncbi:EH signature domain-containing protein [Rhodospirillum centenum]|uniref:Zorya protein ZorC EH domain-containing protein n=1 Tax=Rhodospirillum centenum (strain ATCC 51521 / SW) TaxID=414684 RepID=B6IPM7_RHOCS|nr:EH signature domain-containing protein [Rhodospirillum centenum]ACI99729.1 hypothetical protein RC1_2343 [Rhodospirillum centenum SW]
MSLMREALISLQATAGRLPHYAMLPDMPESGRLVTALAGANAAPAPPGDDMLAAVRRRLLEAARGPGGVAAAAPRDLCDAPWLMWGGLDPLAGLNGLLEAVLDVCNRRNRARRTLIEAWIRNFSYDMPRIAEAGNGIRRLITAARRPRLEPWRDADAWCRLFDAADGPRTLARWIVLTDEPVDTLLGRACLDDPMRASSGYARTIQAEVLSLVPDHLAGPAGAQRVARVADFLAPGDSLRFDEPESRGQIVRSLMAPWLTGRSGLEEPTRAAVQKFLLARLGDPRTRPGQWVRAGEDAVALMETWLSRAALGAFFDLVGEQNHDPDWRYREAFWSACMEAGGIDDAWLALGRTVRRSAPALHHLKGAYGELVGPGFHGDQTVLLLRVRDTVFCEWSHAGKLRAWPAEGEDAPRLHRASYTRPDLTAPCLPFPPNKRHWARGSSDGNGLSHVGSESSRWQGSVARLLEERAGIALTAADWMPGRA